MNFLSDFPKGSKETSVMHPFRALKTGIKPSTGKKLSQEEENKLWVDYGKAVEKNQFTARLKRNLLENEFRENC